MMKVYKLSINPKSTFLTYPKGDMIYGFFMYWWNRLGYSILDIKDKIVFSDFLPDGYFRKPAFEFTKFTDNENERKDIKSIEWISEETISNGNLKNILNDEKKDFKFYIKRKSVKNHINKLHFTTSENFAPYVIEEIEFVYQIVMYVATSLNIKEIIKFLNKIGEYGFGKRSSVGKGMFEILKYEECSDKFNRKGNYYLALSPLLTSKEAKYNLFTRYGKFYANSKPFKNPVVLMDSGSVVLEKCEMVEGKILENKDRNYFIQAKSIMLPFNLKDKNESKN